MRFQLVYFVITLLYVSVLDAKLTQSISDGEFSATITLSQKDLSLDEQLQITLVFKHPENYQVDVKELRQSLLSFPYFGEPPFAFVDDRIKKEKKKTVVEFVLEPLIPGHYPLTFYDLTFLGDDGTVKTLLSDIFEIEILPLTIANKEQKPSLPLLSLEKLYPLTLSANNRLNLIESVEKKEAARLELLRSFRSKRIPWQPIAAIIVFILLFLLVKMQPDQTTKKKEDPAAKKRKALIQALQNLEQIEKGAPCYPLLVATLKEYIEEVFSTPARSLSDQEFLKSVGTFPFLETDEKNLLQSVIKQGMIIKFTPKTATQEEEGDVLQKVRSWLESRD